VDVDEWFLCVDVDVGVDVDVDVESRGVMYMDGMWM